MAVATEEKATEPIARRTRWQRWRRVQAVGALLLAASFFLPAVRACRSDFIPCREVLQAAREIGDVKRCDLSARLAWTSALVAPYLFGGIVLVGLRRRRGRGCDEVRLGVGPTVLLAVVGVFWTTLAAADIVMGQLRLEPSALFLGLLLLTLAYFVRGVMGGAGGRLCIQWYASSCCVAWFAFWIIDALYGLRVSFGGAWLIWLGSWGEAAVLSRRGAMRTLGDLALCRLRVYALDDSQCTNCGYSLFGLPSNRCPECGQTFTQRLADDAQPPVAADAPAVTGAAE